MRVLHQILSGLIIALGCLHVGFTPLNYSHFDIDAMWFLSAGVAIILAGFLNVALIRVGKDRVIRILCVLTNASFAILFGVALFQMPQPQVLVGLTLFALALVCSVLTGGRRAQDSA